MILSCSIADSRPSLPKRIPVRVFTLIFTHDDSSIGWGLIAVWWNQVESN